MDVVLYIDADALIFNLDKTFDKLIFNIQNKQKSLFISRDVNGLNNGIFWIKKTQFINKLQ